MISIRPPESIVVEQLGLRTDLTPKERLNGLLASARTHLRIARNARQVCDMEIAKSALDTAKEKLAKAKRLRQEL